ncbi:type II toxin-antitoxin system VapC family toxin [Actinophytocola sp. NPDC049390]|uniref:type II toxin-antitoxin system VapC family toxin n=1 Tax=Actinophytocola sp. NPDC049390 TaxID=3363894 RepID=UPI00378C398A
MIIDSSAVVAVILREEGSERVLEALETADACRVGAPTLVETAMVLTGRLGDEGRTMLLSLLREVNVDVLSFSDAHWRTAQSAFVRYGKGRHPAALNFGDCLTYATAYVAGEPLLCAGDDFAQTDLELAIKPA